MNEFWTVFFAIVITVVWFAIIVCLIISAFSLFMNTSYRYDRRRGLDITLGSVCLVLALGVFAGGIATVAATDGESQSQGMYINE